MRRKKKERLQAETFWTTFCAINLKGDNNVPIYMHRINFRMEGVTDEELPIMTEVVKRVVQLDMDECEITNEGIRHLLKMESIKELRLKSCDNIDAGCVPDLFKMTDLELLHLGGTSVKAADLKGIGVLKNLRLLLISAEDNEMEDVEAMAKELPVECELLVNHREYIRNKE